MVLGIFQFSGRYPDYIQLYMTIFSYIVIAALYKTWGLTMLLELPDCEQWLVCALEMEQSVFTSFQMAL